MAKKKVSVAYPAELKNFVKLFEKLRYRHSAMTAYSDFVAMSAIALSNSVNFNQDRENEYLRIIKKYSKDEQEVFLNLFAELVKQMQKDAEGTPRYRDVLGELFQALNINDEWKGQFFTPQDVSDLMGEVIGLDKLEELISERGYATVLEPCIGGGSLILGLINAMFAKGLNPCKQLVITAYDLDIRCVHMAYIQLSLAGVPAIIQQRNSLSGETYGDYWFTPVFVIDGWGYKLQFDAQTTQEKTEEKFRQLTLF